jgi:hypothetical protein
VAENDIAVPVLNFACNRTIHAMAAVSCAVDSATSCTAVWYRFGIDAPIDQTEVENMDFCTSYNFLHLLATNRERLAKFVRYACNELIIATLPLRLGISISVRLRDVMIVIE